MNSNTFSLMISFFLGMILYLIGLRLILGPLTWGGVLSLTFMFFPVVIILCSFLYLLINKTLPRYLGRLKFLETQEKTDKNIDSKTRSYKLQKEYLYLGVLILILCLTSVFWISDKISFIFLFIIISHLAYNPYRIDLLEDDSLMIYRVFRKRKRKISEIVMVGKGEFRDKVVFKDDFIYLNHVSDNIDVLTDIIVEKLSKTISTEKGSGLKWLPPKKSAFFIRMFYILFISITFSVLLGFYLKDFVKNFVNTF